MYILNKVIRFFKILILAQALLMSGIIIAYLSYFGFGTTRFESEIIHGLMILVSTGISFFIAYIAFLNYQKTGEVFLRYISLGFFAFFILYFPHSFLGMFGNMPLFLGYGTVSRFTMALYLLYGVLMYRKESDTEEQRKKGWFRHIAILLFISIIGIPFIILGLNASIADVKIPDYITIVIFLGTLIAMFVKRMRRSLYWFYMAAICSFAFTCLAFIFGALWNHYWWSAHFILIAGFYMLLYSLIRRYEITTAFTRAFSEIELYDELANRARTLEEVNTKLTQTAIELETSLVQQKKIAYELTQKNKELEQLTKVLSGRELRMIELKEQVADLESRLKSKT